MSKSLIGVVVVGHGAIATAMLHEAEQIIKETQHALSVPIDSSAPVDSNRQTIATAIERVDQGVGVLLLTDMFGGTPSNLCLSFLEPTRIEVISGVNLPMLIKLLGGMQAQPFTEVIDFIQHYGQKNIVIASKVLEGKIT
jgi:mannose PTS system EIIA component